MLLLTLLTMLTAAALTYTVAGAGSAIALTAGMALESANLSLTDRVGRYLLDPDRGHSGWFQIFYFLKYGAVIAAFVWLAVRVRLGVLPLAAGFTLALALHIGFHLRGRQPQSEERIDAT
ncbi:MAG: hypothetical protein PVF51_05745 [Nitrospirota bacterium]